MDISIVKISRADPARAATTPKLAAEVAARDPARVAETRKSGLETPFDPRKDEASVLKAQLGSTPEAADGDATLKSEGEGLSEAEQAVVDQLSARDREVRNHEEAHARVGGQYAGTPSYTFQQGPDGKSYAIGGEVAIDVAPVADDPQATIVKMEIVKAAALAPAEPSGQDRKVAALADAQRQQAVADLAELRRQTEPAEEPTVDIAA